MLGELNNIPGIAELSSGVPFLWINEKRGQASEILPALELQIDDIEDAERRLTRFAPLIADLFEETAERGGIIESALVPADRLARRMQKYFNVDLKGRFFIKADHALPVAGSVKARGGIYEVLHFAEKLAIEKGMLTKDESYLKLRSDEVRSLFSQYTISVGSTGNLGLSIGITAAALGFTTQVHLSAKAKEWKRELLRQRGVKVVEHDTDYTEAVRAGREASMSDPYVYFVDDEKSPHLFLGYSVAALRLKKQLKEKGIPADREHPLFVYIPCGVGGAPGGITFGLKHVFGSAVHCFFAEPVEAPCMLLGLLTDFREGLSIYDIGLHNDTEADGLAVSAASAFAGRLINRLVSGSVTVTDDDMFRFVYLLNDSQGIRVEPSATAGFAVPVKMFSDEQGRGYVEKNSLTNCMNNAVHILWTTGGLFVPEEEYGKFLERGAALCLQKT